VKTDPVMMWKNDLYQIGLKFGKYREAGLFKLVKGQVTLGITHVGLTTENKDKINSK